MKRKKYTLKKKPKEILSLTPSEFKATCYICNKTKSKDQMVSLSVREQIYRCRGGKCEKLVIQRTLIKHGITPDTMISEFITPPEKAKRGRPPKDTKLTGGHAVNGKQQKSDVPVLSVTNKFNIPERSQG